MNYKYILMPGMVTSKYDGDRHFISASQLCELYKVNIRDCYVFNKEHAVMMPPYLEGLPVLAPRYDGNYYLPES